MIKKLAVLPLAAFAAACANHLPYDEVSRGISPINEPVVATSSYAFDVSAPGGMLPASEAQRLNEWFSTMGLGYGDTVYVDGGPAAASARADVARVAGQYGILLSQGAPVTASPIGAGDARVIVVRTRASVPDCPDWREPTSPTWNNRQHSNFGCAVNGNLAAMVANPQDLVHGREGPATTDTRTSGRAIETYRSLKPTGSSNQLESPGAAQGGNNSGGGN